jgi:hypothetical protein
MGIEWLDGFLKKFVRRLRPPEWPEPGTDEYTDYRDDWAYALQSHNVTEEEANEVLMRLRQDPPQWLREHLPKFLACVTAIRQERAAKGRADDRDTAQAASRDCQHCDGGGFARVYYPEYRGNPAEELPVMERGEVVRRLIPVAVSAHCVCALGRWMRSKIRELDLLARIPDLADVLAGRSRWLAREPTRGERGECRPIEPGRARRELGERMRVR